jgi:hypothetical protein
LIESTPADLRWISTRRTSDAASRLWRSRYASRTSSMLYIVPVQVLLLLESRPTAYVQLFGDGMNERNYATKECDIRGACLRVQFFAFDQLHY